MTRSAARGVTIAQQGTCTLVDPHVWTDAPATLNIRWAVYEPLVRARAGGSHGRALAVDWLTADARSWIFSLRPGVRFHDGRALRAAHVVAALDRARSPSMAGMLGTSGVYHSYLGTATITALDDDRVRLVTPEPAADILDVLADIPIILDAGGTGPDSLVGTGPYRVVDGGSDFLTMGAVGDHWAGRSSVEQVVWRLSAAEQDRIDALLSGEVDVATDLSGQGRRALDRASRTVTVAVPTSACVILLCNATSGVCTDRAVRQALNYALDVPAIIEGVKSGAALPLNGALTSWHLGHDASAPPYHHDPQRALALLEKAGHASGLDVILDIPMTIPDEAAVLADIIARQYRDVGIHVTVRTFVDRRVYAETLKAKRMDDLACFDSTPGSTYRVLREKFHGSAAGPWWQGYRNADVDRTIDEASATPDLRRRRALYRHASRLIRDDAPWVFLYSPLAVVAKSQSVSAVAVEPQGLLTFTATEPSSAPAERTPRPC